MLVRARRGGGVRYSVLRAYGHGDGGLARLGTGAIAPTPRERKGVIRSDTGAGAKIKKKKDGRIQRHNVYRGFRVDKAWYS